MMLKFIAAMILTGITLAGVLSVFYFGNRFKIFRKLLRYEELIKHSR